MRYTIIERDGTRHEDVLATPMLISEGTKAWAFGRWVEGYVMDKTDRGQDIWRMRDDAYDQRQGVSEYKTIQVVAEEVPE